MIDKINKRIVNKKEKFLFKLFSYVLRKYNVEFYYKDSMGILTKRNYTDNFQNIFKTKNSSDAIPMMEALNDKIRNSNICIDVGANIGITSIWMAKNAKQVIAFEPESNNRNRFLENVRANHIDNIDILPYAVSNQEGQSEFYIHKSYGHHSLGKVGVTPIVATKVVQTTTLDVFCKQHKISCIDIVKIDVEGYEEEVLMGAHNLLENKKIKMIILEHSKVIIKILNKNIFAVYDILNGYGYQLYSLDHRPLSRADMNKIEQGDVYAISC